jgi:hypothetical protein
MMRLGCALMVGCVVGVLGGPAATVARPPRAIGRVHVSDITASSATLEAVLNREDEYVLFLSWKEPCQPPKAGCKRTLSKEVASGRSAGGRVSAEAMLAPRTAYKFVVDVGPNILEEREVRKPKEVEAKSVAFKSKG